MTPAVLISIGVPTLHLYYLTQTPKFE